MAAEEPDGSPRRPRRVRGLFRAPPPLVVLGVIVGSGALLSLLFFGPGFDPFFAGLGLLFAGPALVAGALTTPLARALGGRIELHRSLFLAMSVLLLDLPIAALWRGALAVWPSVVPGIGMLGAFLLGPTLWFRQMTLYGVSRPSHLRMLPVALAQPVLMLIGLFVLLPPNVPEIAATLAFVLIALGCAVGLVRASDRPLRREFHASGVSLIRPMLDHVGARDPSGTRALEEFFDRSALPTDVRVALLSFVREGRPYVTVALPTVHPGPFAALGASDLPRKLSEQLGPDSGTVLVPHTPSDHDLDLSTEAEVAKVGRAARELLTALPPSRPPRASALVSPYPGSLARAQCLGEAVLVVVTQAPDPTDDIAFSVADRAVREIARDGGPPVVLIDAHNSYVEGQGDISYGSPAAEKLVADVKAAVTAAQSAATDGPIEVGVAVRGGYSIGTDGIGPHGIRALAIRAAGRTSGLVLIDGNNLVIGDRDPIVRALSEVVDDAEVMTTDNHVVHEVDGGINPVGERYPRAALVREARAALAAAVADLRPAEVRFGSREVPAVRVLGPGYTARLLTSLGDTLSMFTHMFAATFLLLLTGSLAVALLLR